MSGPRAQFLVTRFERLSRRISLAGLMSGKKAEEAIEASRVHVNGGVARANFKVFAEAEVSVDGREVPPPGPRPKLWALRKPRNVLCQDAEKEGAETLRSVMRRWREREARAAGHARGVGLDQEGLDDKHFVIVGGLPFFADGLVLLTNDGLFAENLMKESSRILSVYELKVVGDPPVDLLHSWRHGAAAGGLRYGQVFTSIAKRTTAATWLTLRYVETPERPLEGLLSAARLKVNRLRRSAFGPYRATQAHENRIVPLPVHTSLGALMPEADMRQAMVPVAGRVVSSEGRIRGVGLENSAIGPEVPAVSAGD